MARYDRRSDEAKTYREWYRTSDWHRIRQKRLMLEPECRICVRQRKFDPTFRPDPTWRPIVDHIVPHRGDPTLFFNLENTATLCNHHHNSTKQAIENRGLIPVTGVDGWPIEET